jgi:CHAD domain-containing protein
MKFAIKRKEHLPSALRRIALEQLRIAADKAVGAKPSATSIHCARKAIKRVRAVLQLVRHDENGDTVKVEGRALRDAAKLLAANRDLHVQQLALRRLPICSKNGACDVVWKRLRAARNHLKSRTTGDLEQFAKAIKASRANVKGWKVDHVDHAFIADALQRSYRRARKRFKRVRGIPTGEKLHEWRKAVKTLWHQLQLIDRITSKKLCSFSRDAAQLSGLLGDEHDCFILLLTLADATDRDSRAVKRELRSVRAKLTKRALKLGGKAFALAPSAFHEKLCRCVK